MSIILKNSELVFLFILSTLFIACQNRSTSQKCIEIDQSAVQCSEFYKSGSIKYKANFYNDKQHGLFQEYYENGKLKKVSNFINGKENGMVSFYDNNGKLFNKVNLENGVKNGEYISYWRNGVIKAKTNIINNKLEGDFFCFSKRDSVTPIKKYYFKEGVPQEWNKEIHNRDDIEIIFLFPKSWSIHKKEETNTSIINNDTGTKITLVNVDQTMKSFDEMYSEGINLLKEMSEDISILYQNEKYIDLQINLDGNIQFMRGAYFRINSDLFYLTYNSNREVEEELIDFELILELLKSNYK